MSVPVVRAAPAPPARPRRKNDVALGRRVAELKQEVALLRDTLRHRDSEVAVLKGRVSRMQQDQDRMAVKLQENDQSSYVGYLNEEARLRADDIAFLEQQLEANAEKFRDDVRRVAGSYEKKLQQVEMMLDEKVEAVQKLEKEVKALRKFKASKKHIIDDVKTLHREMEDMKSSHDALIRLQEAKIREEVNNMARAYRARADDLERNAQQKTLEKLNDETRRVLRDNASMAQDLKVHYEEGSRMTSQLEAARSTIKELELELNLYKKRDAQRIRILPRLGDSDGNGAP